MRRHKRIILACLLLGLATFGAEATRTAPGAFTSCKASSTSKFVDVIKKDPKLSALYAKHFNAKPEKVVSFFETLKLTRLKKAKRVTCFAAWKGGKITYRQRTLPAGELVFATETDVPILAWDCGNPLTTLLPIEPTPQPKPPTIMVAPAPVQELVPTVAALPVAGLPAEVISDTTLPPLVEVAAAPTLGASISSAGFFLPLIPFGGHDHNTPVPEPSSLVALGIGSAMLGVSLLRRQRRSHAH